MCFSTLVTCLALLSTTGWAQYTLEDDYMAGGNFFDMFTFWDTADPTDGFVAYQAYGDAVNANLVSNSSTNVQMRVDSSNVTPNGRPSVRITSNKSYQSGLIILDVEHMPGGVCGTWPAFWTVGPDWPNQGEIDIIEGVNQQSSNDMTLHTGEGCSISSSGATFSGSITTTDCWIDDPNQANNAGCQITTSNTDTYGTGFNANNGGVYATEWTDSSISIFFFPRGSIPSDITNGSPDPSTWGTPLAEFQGGCDIGTTFTNQQIVFDTTFCGAWAGAVWSTGSCASMADTCNDYVENNPQAFADAYWSVNALQVYQQTGSSSSNVYSSSALSSATPVSSVAASSWSSSAAEPSSSAEVSPTTFATSTSAFNTPPPTTATPTYTAGNASLPSFPSGSGSAPVGSAPAGSAPVVSAPIASAPAGTPSAPFSVSAASAPSSPPDVSSSVAAPAPTSAASVESSTTESFNWHTHTWDGQHHHNYERSTAAKRHLRHRKRHGAGVM